MSFAFPTPSSNTWSALNVQHGVGLTNVRKTSSTAPLPIIEVRGRDHRPLFGVPSEIMEGGAEGMATLVLWQQLHIVQAGGGGDDLVLRFRKLIMSFSIFAGAEHRYMAKLLPCDGQRDVSQSHHRIDIINNTCRSTLLLFLLKQHAGCCGAVFSTHH